MHTFFWILIINPLVVTIDGHTTSTGYPTVMEIRGIVFITDVTPSTIRIIQTESSVEFISYHKQRFTFVIVFTWPTVWNSVSTTTRPNHPLSPKVSSIRMTPNSFRWKHRCQTINFQGLFQSSVLTLHTFQRSILVLIWNQRTLYENMIFNTKWIEFKFH